jgi:D-alanyl-D-alanine carboxypeptidase
MTVAPTSVHHAPRWRQHLLLSIAALAAAAGVVLLVQHDVFQQGSGRAARPELQRILDSAVTGPDRIAPGATAYVSGPNGSWLGSSGAADVRTGERMQPDARMRLESVSKIWTATLIMQLRQEGRLRLGDTVEKWLPGLLPYGGRITIEQLLSMRSGLIDNNDLLRTPRIYLARVKDTRLRAQLLALGERIDANPALEVSPMWWIRWAAWQPLLSAPGTTYHYSNIGYDLLGLIAAHAGDKPISQLYQKRIFTPLGLENSAYDPQGPIAGQHSRGHTMLPGGTLKDATNLHFGVGAEGGIVSNAQETATFLTGLMSGKLLDRRQVLDMQAGVVWPSGADSGCADPAYGWSGGGAGFKSEVWVSGDGKRVTVLLLNARVGGKDRGTGDMAAFATMERLYCAA